MMFALTRISKNVKTGPIPTVVISSDTCPPDCPYQGSGCYAEVGPLAIHWSKVTDGNRGVGFKEFIEQVLTLPVRGLWRYAVAGDLPGKGNRINRKDTETLVKANAAIQGKGFTYTHKPPHKWNNGAIIAAANAGGFTVNLSSNHLAHADELMKLGIAPVVTILPADTGDVVEYREPKSGKMLAARKWLSMATEEGYKVVQCPAEYRPEINCGNCGSGSAFCQRSDRKFIVGFTSHGTRKNKASQIARGLPVVK
jgi:hypothetical protein